jgi:phage shock protein PspC (stress-responsive transcriptional regulator)
MDHVVIAFQQEAIRVARKISTVVLAALAAYIVVWIVMAVGK